jgi:thioredoxin reductase (NADPH)
MTAAEESAPARRPAILAVDDEPAVLAAVARDLRRGSASATGSCAPAAAPRRWSCSPSSSSAATRSRCCRRPAHAGHGRDRLPRQARKLVPDAKRVLLTAYADTEAAIAAINAVALDYYLLKPWDPPEEQLYPVVEDLLTTWEAGAALESGGVRIIGHRFSRDSPRPA